MSLNFQKVKTIKIFLKFLVVIILVLVIGGAILGRYFNHGIVVQEIKSNPVELVLPEIKMTDFGEKALSIMFNNQSNQSKSWVIINIWATWCLPCLNEIPELDDFYRNDQTLPFKLIGITYEDLTQDQLQTFFKHHFQSQPSYPILIQTKPQSLILEQQLAIGMPQTYIFNPQGKLVKLHLGELSSAMLAFELKELLENNI